MRGKWRITQMPAYVPDYPNMMGPAYIFFDGKGGGEFAFGCVTGAIYGAGDEGGNAVEFTWQGNDEMDEACGDGWVEKYPDGSIEGQISFFSGQEAEFKAQPWINFSAAC